MGYAEFSALVDLPRFQALDEDYGSEPATP